jgi:hypothetical protein
MYEDYEIPDISTPEYIKNIRTIFKNIDYTHKVSTRGSSASNNCRSSQLKFLLFYLYLLNNKKAIKFFHIFHLNERERSERERQFLQKTYFDVKQIFISLSERNSFIRQTYNVNNPRYVVKINELSLGSYPSIDFYGIRVWPLCVYWEGRGIIHYFSLIEQYGNYFIFNSYGSDYVCIQPYISPIDLDVFNNFIIGEGDANDFIRNYFILREAGLDVEAVEETMELKSKGTRMVDKNRGEEAELKIFQKKDWSVGYIPLISVLVDDIYRALGKPSKLNKSKRKKISRKIWKK